MQPEAYRQMSETEDSHWWFVGRRAILSAVIGAMLGERRVRIIEIGSGTGGNVSMLQRWGDVTAVEMDATARELAEAKTGVRVRGGSLPDNLGVPAESFDLVCMFDVLEHIDDDIGALRDVSRLLAPGARILLTVPAHPFLWGPHDEFLHHKRRYTREALEKSCAAAGLRATRLAFFNFWLFPIAVTLRVVQRLSRNSAVDGGAVPFAPLNKLFTSIFASEAGRLRRRGFPTGLSLLAVLERP